MQVYTQLGQNSKKPSAVALGFFDGVHIAHAEVIRKVTEQEGMVPTVLTFSGNELLPKHKNGAKEILSEDQKLARFEELGVKQVFELDFSGIASLPAQCFLEDILVKQLHASCISCGYDYTFGKNAAGNVELLQQFCGERNLSLHVLSPLTLDGKLVSSTAIRRFLLEGDIPSANRMLGYPYSIWGEVVPGRHLGRTLGFPTLNQRFSENRIVPQYGVYASISRIDGKEYRSITNIGIKPTIPGLREPLAETHLLGGQGDFYGKTAQVSLLTMMRPEMRFSDVAELKTAVLRDIASRKEL